MKLPTLSELEPLKIEVHHKQNLVIIRPKSPALNLTPVHLVVQALVHAALMFATNHRWFSRCVVDSDDRIVCQIFMPTAPLLSSVSESKEIIRRFTAPSVRLSRYHADYGWLASVGYQEDKPIDQRGRIIENVESVERGFRKKSWRILKHKSSRLRDKRS